MQSTTARTGEVVLNLVLNQVKVQEVTGHITLPAGLQAEAALPQDPHEVPTGLRMSLTPLISLLTPVQQFAK